MGKQKRKIETEAFVRDLRLGMSEDDLTLNYGLSRVQLFGEFRKLVCAGAVDTTELCMQTQVSDSAIIEFVAETVLTAQDGDQTVQALKPASLYSETKERLTAQCLMRSWKGLLLDLNH
jgi:hypothetical protein